MSRSWREIPHYHLRQRINLEAALTWLDRHNSVSPAEQRIVPAALLLRAVARAASTCELVNGAYVDNRFEPSSRVNLGVAVALRDGGLLTPAVADADQLSVVELMARLRDLVTRARVGRLRASETTGATITVTNLGDVGVDEVAGVIFPPQVALVGFGAIHEEPWARGGMLGAARVVNATLAGDHRVSDGRTGGVFLATIDRLLQEPTSL
jgi:pyruvate dehydrogenase E2 component (dihydrolipoamide acetyltransferase)